MIAMPRRARVSLPNIPHHVTQRGNNRQACFYAGQDYQFFLEWLIKYAREFEYAIHAYVLLTNHVHLLMTPKQGDTVGRTLSLLPDSG